MLGLFTSSRSSTYNLGWTTCESNWLNLICHSYLKIRSYIPSYFYQPSRSLKGFDETLGNYRNASHHYTLEHSSDNKTFSWGDQPFLNHLSPEWEEQLGDCAELDDKTSWFCEVAMLLPFPTWQVSNFRAKKCLSRVQNSKTTKIYSRITFEY